MAKYGRSHCAECGAPLPAFERSRGTPVCYGCDMESCSKVELEELYVIVHVGRPCGSRLASNTAYSSEDGAWAAQKKLVKQMGIKESHKGGAIDVVPLKDELARECTPEHDPD